MKRILMKLLDGEMEMSSKDIIKFIYSEIEIEENNKKLTLTYTNAKKLIREKYCKKEKNELIEEYYNYYYKKTALKSINSENLTMGGISIIAIMISIVAIFCNNTNDINQYRFFFLYSAVSLFVFFLLLDHRMKKKSKKIIYYDIILETIKKLLKNK